MSDPVIQPQDWWMYHKDPAHTGFVGLQESRIHAGNVADHLKQKFELELDGPVLSVPAVVQGFVYVGIANSRLAEGGNGGTLYKISLDSGAIAAHYTWHTPVDQRDSHGFTGMGCTPAVKDGRVIFSAFDGKVFCLCADDLSEQWVLNLRFPDPAHGQPVDNSGGISLEGYPPAAGWSSPVIVGERAYVGFGEGENPYAWSFVYAIDVTTGNVDWLFCTNQFRTGEANRPNVIPLGALPKGERPPPKYRVFDGQPITMGCSVWSSIAYDAQSGWLICATGNAVPDGPLPSLGYSNGLLALDAKTGEFRGFWQVPAYSNYRPSDFDVDIGGSPVIFTRNADRARQTIAVACKNGAFFLVNLENLAPVAWRQMLPYTNDGLQIPTVDAHPPGSEPNPRLTNAQSNATQGENYYGSYSTPAVQPTHQQVFVGVGGNNYHTGDAGIDFETTPFLRALSWSNVADAWPLDDGDPQRYAQSKPPMYTNPGEGALSAPAVANDVVFCSTNRVALYAFSTADGTPLWSDVLGEQTGGYQGGYGYCMGPALYGDYVVAGALIYGRKGGLLRIYQLQDAAPPPAGQALQGTRERQRDIVERRRGSGE